MRLLLPFLALLLGVACSSTPGYVIPEKKMAALMADIYIGDAVVEGSPREWRQDSLRQVLLHSIYSRHGVTAEDVDSSLTWYGHNMQAYMDMCKLTEEILQKRIDEEERQGARGERVVSSVSVDGDSVDVWPGIRSRRNIGLAPSDYTTFALQSDRNWDRGDRYTLSLKGLMTRMPVTLFLAVEYNDGSGESRTYVGPAEGLNRVTLVLDSARNASSVYGAIKYVPAPGEVSYLDSISLYRTRMRSDNRSLRQGQVSFKN